MPPTRSKQQRGLVHILLIEADALIAADIQPVLRSCAGKVTVAAPAAASLDSGRGAPPYSLVVCAGINSAARENLMDCLQSPALSGRVVLVLPGGAEAEAVSLVEMGLHCVLVHDSAGKFLHLLRPMVKRLLLQHAAYLWEPSGDTRAVYPHPTQADADLTMVIRFLPDTTLTFVNDAYCRFVQKPREELIGQPLLTVIPEEAREVAMSNIDALSVECPVHSAQYLVPMNDGTQRWYEWTETALMDSTGILREIQAVGRDITPLKNSEVRYRRLFEGMGDAALIADAETGVFLDANAQAEMLFKRSRAELIGAHHSILLPPERRTVGEALFRHHVREGGNLESKLEIMRGDGKVAPTLWRSTVMEFDGRRRLLSVFHDVSCQAAVEHALRESEERFREFVEGTDNLVVQIDPDGRLLYLNRAGERLFRSPSSACQGLRILDFMHPEDRSNTADQFDAWIRSTVSGGTLESRMLGPGGESRSILWTVSLHYEDAGALAYINAIGRDVTEWKRADQELRASEHAMRRLYEITAARWRDGARTIRDLLMFGAGHFDLGHGVVVQATESGARVSESTSFPPRWEEGALQALMELLPAGMDAAPVEPVHFEDGLAGSWPEREAVRRLGVRSFLGTPLFVQERVYGLLAFFDFEARQPFSGRERELLKLMAQWVETVIQMGLAAENHDRLQARIQQAQKLESLGIMAGGVAHDFNNLLLSILGNADLLRQDAPAGSPAAETAAQIVLAAHRAAELTSHMLAYTGQGKTRREVININSLVDEISGLLLGTVSRETALHLELAEELPGVNGDATQLRQVALNLIKNAAEAMAGKAGRIEIRTALLHCTSEYLSGTYLQDPLDAGDYVCIEVSDTGCGMSPDVLARIFDPFFTTKFTGRGLGLAAVMGIVRGHLGAVDVSSQPGEGTRFKILLPAAGTVAPAEATSATRRAWRMGTETILVIEDEAPVRRLTSRILTRAGFTVLLAATGDEGLELFKSRAEEVDLVLLDFIMAPMSGEDVYWALQEERPGVNVLLTSGYSREEVAKRLNGSDFQFIQKPYEPAELTHAVRRVLERKALA